MIMLAFSNEDEEWSIYHVYEQQRNVCAVTFCKYRLNLQGSEVKDQNRKQLRIAYTTNRTAMEDPSLSDLPLNWIPGTVDEAA